MTLNMKEIKPGFQTLEEGEIQWLENVGTVWLEQPRLDTMFQTVL